MSLQITEDKDVIIDFPADKNVRVKITGLGLCTFTAAESTVRFLRHVKHHELLMKITQMKRDSSEKKTFTVKIEPTQNVLITGETVTPINNHVFNPSFEQIIKMRKLHGRPLRDRDAENLPTPFPTTLKLQHCAFYSDKLTDSLYKLKDVDDTTVRDSNKKYCEVLAGYMAYGNKLIISLNNGIPLEFPLGQFVYEIAFNNSCDTSPGCREEEDFIFIYDIVRETGNPGRVLRLVEDRPRAINTGACLPVCEDCL